MFAARKLDSPSIDRLGYLSHQWNVVLELKIKTGWILRFGSFELSHVKQDAAACHPAPKGQGVHAHAKPQTI
jgi:hypothetical protein